MSLSVGRSNDGPVRNVYFRISSMVGRLGLLYVLERHNCVAGPLDALLTMQITKARYNIPP